MANIIIDFEFTGLPNHAVSPEIVQVLAMNVDNGKSTKVDFKSFKPMTAGALICCGGYDPNKYATNYFTSCALYEILKNGIDAKPDDHYFGFNIATDSAVLRDYGVVFENYTDLVELCMLSDIEYRMAVEGRSLECVYYFITGQIPHADHGTFDELNMIKTIYDYVVDKNGIIKPVHGFLSYVPWGEHAGMEIREYVERYRRRADGYRFNNDNLFAKALSFEISLGENYYNDIDEDE